MKPKVARGNGSPFYCVGTTLTFCKVLRYYGVEYDSILLFLRSMIIAGIGSKRLFGRSLGRHHNYINLDFVAENCVF